VTWIWWAPLVAAALHIVEEFVYPGGFARWDRAYRPDISASITSRFHVVINGLLPLLCAQVWELGWVDTTGARAVAGTAWLVVAALLFSNAVFHVVGSIQTKSRSPGVVTSVLIYVPLALYGYWWFVSSGRVLPVAALGAGIAGGSHHVWAKLIHVARAGRRFREEAYPEPRASDDR
jgi:hypothetical protein